jgi:hypothetical protein
LADVNEQLLIGNKQLKRFLECFAIFSSFYVTSGIASIGFRCLPAGLASP